jgi:hypothetical protein
MAAMFFCCSGLKSQIDRETLNMAGHAHAQES